MDQVGWTIKILINSEVAAMACLSPVREMLRPVTHESRQRNDRVDSYSSWSWHSYKGLSQASGLCRVLEHVWPLIQEAFSAPTD